MSGVSRTVVGTVGSLGAMIGAGIFLAPAPAAAVGGWWLLAGIAVAGLLALATTTTARPAQESTMEWSATARDAADVLAPVLAVAAVARSAGSYLYPAHPLYPALAVVGAGALAVRARGVLAARAGAMLTCFVIAVLLVVAISCFAIPPPESGGVVSGLPGADDPAGVPTAAALMVFAFGGSRASARHVRPALVVVTVLYLVVAFAVVHQLGPARLALSPVPLRDGLVAAGGIVLVPLVLVGCAVAALVVSTRALACGAEALGRRIGFRSRLPATVLVVLAAWLGCWLMPPVFALAAASAVLLLRWFLAQVESLAAYGTTTARADGTSRRRMVLSGGALVVTVVLLVSLPVPELLTGLCLVIAGALLCAFVPRALRR